MFKLVPSKYDMACALGPIITARKINRHNERPRDGTGIEASRARERAVAVAMAVAVATVTAKRAAKFTDLSRTHQSIKTTNRVRTMGNMHVLPIYCMYI